MFSIQKPTQKPYLPILLGTAALLAGLNAHAQVYDKATRQLTLPNVQVGNLTYPNVVIRLDRFEVLREGAQVNLPLAGFAQTYDPATRQLSLPEVQVGNNRILDVLVRLDSYLLLAAGEPVRMGPPAPGASGALPAAFEQCPASQAAAPAAPVATTLEVQSAPGWVNADGSLSAVANGTRAHRGGGPSSAVNCISWRDASKKARALNLGAYMFDYVLNDKDMRAVATDDADGQPGFGFVVSHNTANGNSPLGSFMPATGVKTTVMAGANHAIHQVTMNYTRDTEGGGNGIVIPVVIEWLVAAGRSSPVWAVNWKMSSVINPNNTDFMAYKMDSRGPYGSIGWDGKTKSSGASEAVTRMEWGAGGQRFVATAANGVRNSTAWTYNTPDAVNYTRAQAASDLEFGIVQTAVDKFMGYQEFVAGRIVGRTSANYGNACVDNGTLMPCSYGWPYQMMQYSAADGSFGPAPTTGKLMAWGTPYGWLGAQSFPSFDYSTTATGVGERTYGTFIAWGRNGMAAGLNDPVNAAKAYAETASVNTSAQINGGFGTVARLSANPGSMFMRSLLANGYNANYSAFEVAAAANKVDVTYTLNNAPNPLVNPMVIVNGYNGPAPALKWNGIALASGTDYLASYDTQGQRLWVTVLRTIAANNNARLQVN